MATPAQLRPWTAEDRAKIISTGVPERLRVSGGAYFARYVRARSRDGRDMADFMLKVLHGKQVKVGGRNLSPGIRHAMAAADWLADRAFGKPREEIQLSDGDTRAERLTLLASMSDEDRATLRALMVRAIEARDALGQPGDAPAP